MKKDKKIFPLAVGSGGGGGGGEPTGNYVPLSRTVAGVSLEFDISAQNLTDALVTATNAEVDALF